MAKSATKLSLLCIALATALAGCSSVAEYGPPSVQPGPLVLKEPANGDLIPRAEPPSRTGNPDTYVVSGRRYRVEESSAGYREQGIASWYGRGFHGRKTSSGPLYNMFDLTAAHKSLPIPTYVRVTNLENGRNVVVKVNDRGPFVRQRIIDLSYAAANRLDMLGRGTAQVEIVALEPYQFVPALAARRSKTPELLANRQALPNAPSLSFGHNDTAQLAEAKSVVKVAALDTASAMDKAVEPTAKPVLQSAPLSVTIPDQVASKPTPMSSNLDIRTVAPLPYDANKLALVSASSDKLSLAPITTLDQKKAQNVEEAPILDVPAVRSATAKKPRLIAYQRPAPASARPTPPTMASTKAMQKLAPKPTAVARAPVTTSPDQNRITSSPLRVATAEPLLKNKRTVEERRTSTDSAAKNGRPNAAPITTSLRTEGRAASERPAMTIPREHRKATSPTNRQESRSPSRAEASRSSDIRLVSSRPNRSRLVTD